MMLQKDFCNSGGVAEYIFLSSLFCNIDDVAGGLLQRWWCCGLFFSIFTFFCNIDVVPGGFLQHERYCGIFFSMKDELEKTGGQGEENVRVRGRD